MVDGHSTQCQRDTPSLEQATPTSETSKLLPDQLQTPGELSSFHGYLSIVSITWCIHSLVPVESEDRKESVISASGIFLSLTVEKVSVC